jgi:hypothetical protein
MMEMVLLDDGVIDYLGATRSKTRKLFYNIWIGHKITKSASHKKIDEGRVDLIATLC